MTFDDRPREEDGAALLMAIMASLVVSALGVALILGTTSETMMASNFQRSVEAQYAAEAAVARTASDAAAAADWTAILSGLSPSSFVDGPATGTRPLADGASIDLSGIVNLADCGRQACGDNDLDSITAERPWGRNNPRWQLYGFGAMTDLAPDTGPSDFYLVVLAADDPSENDNQPLVDGGPPVNGEAANGGAGALVLRAEAFGPRGSHARVDALLRRGVGIESWRRVR